jgi:hypothetical protein
MSGMVLLLSIVFSGKAIAQPLDWRSKIDQVIRLADSLAMLSQQTFHLQKYTRNDRSVRETWHYTLHNDRVIIFEVHFFVDATEFIEVYYLDRDKVVCMEIYAVLYMPQGEERILWGEVGFFEGFSRRQFVTLGTPDPYLGTDSEWNALTRFKDRYRELLANRPLQEKNRKALSLLNDRN